MDEILERIKDLALQHDYITPEIIMEKDVKPGLRNPDGSGVIVGITTKGSVNGYEKVYTDRGKNEFYLKPIDGKLYYCGYNIETIVSEIISEDRYGFDEVAYLLLTGVLPSTQDLDRFSDALAKRRALSKIERSIVMEEVVNYNQMYGLHSVVSHLSRCDSNPDSTSIEDVFLQCVNLIAKMPQIVAANHNVMRFRKGADLRILRPKPELSTAQDFLYMLKGEMPTDYEAHLFDICMILHAEHGGGNNSTFSVRSVTSSGANTYMAIAAGIASLSGHLHGGANESVMKMMKDIRKNVKDWQNEKQLRKYLTAIIDKKAGDGSGKIYGLGHAVYTLSDPRAVILKRYAREYAAMKGMSDRFHFYEEVERISSEILTERKGSIIRPNVDFYSGFIYKMLGIPRELYTPIFAMSRVVGWSAHRLEQLVLGKIIRPAYISPRDYEQEYVSLKERK